MKTEVIFSKEDEQLRLDLKKYLTENGVMNKKIAAITELPEPYVCLFLKGKKILPNDKLDIIRSFIGR